MSDHSLAAVDQKLTPVQRLATFATFCLLMLTLVIGTGEYFHGQLLRLGEKVFGDPTAGVQYSFLRGDMSKPDCDPHADVNALVDKEVNKPLDEIEIIMGTTMADRDRGAITQSVTQSLQVCAEKFELYGKLKERITPSLKAYRACEKAFFGLFNFGTSNRTLILMSLLAIATLITTLGKHHIAIRPISTQTDHKVVTWAMLLGNVLMLASCLIYVKSQLNAGIPVEWRIWAIQAMWIFIFTAMAVINLFQLRQKLDANTPKGSFGLALLAIPLFSYMSISGCLQFMFMLGYGAGSAVYLGFLTDNAGMFLSLATYIWAGMLLLKTNMVDSFINVLRPFNLAPETLTWVIMIGAGFATAFTGASGIFILAAGAIIYREVMNAGARRQYALATTAMSGSLGVVLSPCLLIVVIAALNKQVTTDVLYHAGVWVFILTSSVFFGISLLLSEQKFRLAPLSQALPQAARNLLPVIPYIVIAVVGYYFYLFALNTKLDEFTAPVIVPLMVFFVVLYDQWLAKYKVLDVFKYESVHKVARVGLMPSLRSATFETVGHIGALVILMALSVGIGGLIERSEVLHLVPADLGGPVPAIALLLVLMVIVGMIMEPFGAVVLVSGTVAPIAYANGVHPVHFWMIVLTAFELGYLSPPVALNQLLARQVVGEAEMKIADDEVRGRAFFWRFERWILPVIVMGICLLVVAYAPYMLKMFGWYQ